MLVVLISIVAFAVILGIVPGPLMSRTLNAQVPRDFPIYPGSLYEGRSVAISDCTYVEAAWTTTDSPAQALSYYSTRLDLPPLTILSRGSDRVDFDETGQQEFWGRIVIRPQSGRTRVELTGHFTADAFGKPNPSCAHLAPPAHPR